MKCLIVENNTAMRRLLRRLVTELAYETYECQDGFEAIICYEQIHPDWVLMDIELPGQNGISATRQIKAQWPHANILMVTSYDEPALRQAAEAAGANGYVLKDNLVELPRWLQSLHATETTNPTYLPTAEKGSFQ